MFGIHEKGRGHFTMSICVSDAQLPIDVRFCTSISFADLPPHLPIVKKQMAAFTRFEIGETFLVRNLNHPRILYKYLVKSDHFLVI